VIARIIRAQEAPTAATVSNRVPPAVPDGDRDHFIALVLDEFTALHPGNAVRFGIRPLELAAWRARFGA
jgi:hypothetical protein